MSEHLNALCSIEGGVADTDHPNRHETLTSYRPLHRVQVYAGQKSVHNILLASPDRAPKESGVASGLS